MAWIASVGGGAGIWVKLPGEENLTMSRNCKSSLAWALLATLLLTRVLLAQSPNADLILIHGHILTLDGTDSLAQAMAIRQGVIVKVGTDAEVLEFAGSAPGMRVIDLHGHTATPGLIVTHAHFAEGGVEELYGVKLSDATSVKFFHASLGNVRVRINKPRRG